MCINALKHAALGLTVALIWTQAVFAAAVNEIQPLNFGEWAVTSNSVAHNVNIDADGTYTNSPALVLVGDPPTRGEYLITGLAVSTAISSIDVVQLSEMAGPGSEGFSMNNFEVNYPGGTSTNGLGNITIYLGARANTSATGVNYADGVHTGQLELTFNY